MKSMGREQDTSVRSEPKKFAKFSKIIIDIAAPSDSGVRPHQSGPPALRCEPGEEEAYPTESRMKQKAKHAAEKALTGEKHKPKKKLVHIEPGYDDCGEDDSSILEDTGDVYWIGDIPSTPARNRKRAERLLEAFLTEFEGEYNPRNRLFGSEVYGCFPSDAH